LDTPNLVAVGAKETYETTIPRAFGIVVPLDVMVFVATYHNGGSNEYNNIKR
jgi:hypothetical protein